MQGSKQAYFVIILLGISVLSCRTLSNRIEMNTLVCGEDYKGDDSFFVVHDPHGRRLNDTEFDVIRIDGQSEVVTPSSKGCVQKPADGEYLLRSRLSDWARVLKAVELNSMQSVGLLDHGDSIVAINCDEIVPRHVNREFPLDDVIIRSLSSDFEKGYEVSYEVSDEKGFIYSISQLSLDRLSKSTVPFAGIASEKPYFLSVKVKNNLKNRELTEKRCKFYVDNAPPEADLAINGKVDGQVVLINGSGRFKVAEIDSVLSFTSRSSDVGEIFYCAESLDESEIASASEVAASECEASKIKSAKPDSPISIDERRGLWKFRFYATDRLGNRSVIHARNVIFQSSTAIELANTVGFGEVSRLLYEGNSLEAASQALKASSLFHAFATFYEKDQARTNVLVGLLNLVDKRIISIPLKDTRTEISAAKFTPDGMKVISAEGRSIKIWDAKSGKLLHSLSDVGRDTISQLSLDAQGRFIAAGFPGSPSRIYSSEDYSLVAELALETNFLRSSAISPDGKLYATGAENGIIRIWDISSGEEIKSLGDLNSPIRELRFSEAGDSLMSTSAQPGLREWDYRTGTLTRNLAASAGEIYSFASDSSSGRVLLAPIGSNLEIREKRSGGLLKTFEKEGLHQVFQLRDDDSFLSATLAGELKYHFLSSFEAPLVFRLTSDSSLRSIDASSDRSQVLAVGTYPLSLQLQNIIGSPRPQGFEYLGAAMSRGRRVHSDGKSVRLFSDQQSIAWGHEEKAILSKVDSDRDDEATVLGLSREGELAIYALDAEIIGVDFSTRNERFRSKACVNGDRLNRAVFTHDNQRVVVTCDESWAVIDLKEGSVVRSYPSDLPIDVSLEISPSDTLLYRGSYKGTIHVMDINSGALVSRLEGHTGHVVDMNLSKDGRRLVTASWDKTIKLWDIDSGKLLRTFEGYKESLSSVVFAGGDQLLFSGGKESGIRIWDVESGAQLGKIQEGELSEVASLSISLNGEYLIADDGFRVRIVDLSVSRLTNLICRAVRSSIVNEICRL